MSAHKQQILHRIEEQNKNLLRLANAAFYKERKKQKKTPIKWTLLQNSMGKPAPERQNHS